jgi:hypothetical protein
MWPKVTGANFPILVGGMAVSLHHHLHAGQEPPLDAKTGEPAHEVVADSAKRLPLRSRSELTAPHRRSRDL